MLSYHNTAKEPCNVIRTHVELIDRVFNTNFYSFPNTRFSFLWFLTRAQSGSSVPVRSCSFNVTTLKSQWIIIFCIIPTLQKQYVNVDDIIVNFKLLYIQLFTLILGVYFVWFLVRCVRCVMIMCSKSMKFISSRKLNAVFLIRIQELSYTILFVLKFTVCKIQSIWVLLFHVRALWTPMVPAICWLVPLVPVRIM